MVLNPASKNKSQTPTKIINYKKYVLKKEKHLQRGKKWKKYHIKTFIIHKKQKVIMFLGGLAN